MVTLTRVSALKIAAPLVVFGFLLLLPPPEGLTAEGQRALAIMALEVVWWATEALPVAVAGIGWIVLLVPNIAGYLALVIPVAMAAGNSLGLTPLVCGMAAVVVGDSVVYYPAGGTSGLFIFQRAGIRAPEVFRFGLVMSLVAILVLFVLVLSYWDLVGQPLVR